MRQINGVKVDLKIDFREQRSGIIEELMKCNGQLTYEVDALPVGDYWIGDRIILERKTIVDFLDSIKTGRIFHQAYRIAESGKNGLLLLEGDKQNANSGLLSRNAVQGALIHLTVFLGIPVIRSLNISETAHILIYILDQSHHHELPRPKPIIVGLTGIRVSKNQRQKLFLLQNLPGIGTKKGLALLRSFGKIENILNAPPEDLMKIKGIGLTLANRVYQIFHEPF